MKNALKTLVFFLLFLSQNSMFSQNNFHQTVEANYNTRKALNQKNYPQHFNMLDTISNRSNKLALQFLLAYSPLSDLADLSPQFFYKQVVWANEIRNNFTWGNKVPENLFYHFVLPFRVNNETPDTARIVFFKELKPRLQGMSMYDAALEVNHWCHEKVSYKASDSRTSAPLATVKTAYGRCGEESTFTVAAMRAVGIPARQVYTPRWAHTDNNHAWVEVWVDGKWWFLGACEPDPELNMGWFAFPATRAIMMHTNVFGNYNGDEDNISNSEYITKINCLNTYADTKNIVIKAVDKNNMPIANATVRVNVYNHAEFYPFVSLKTDENGICSLRTGFGDLWVELSDGKNYGAKKLPAQLTDTLTIGYEISEKDFIESFTPPIGREIATGDDEKNKINQERLKEEDKIREAYIATFPTKEQIENFMQKEGIEGDDFADLVEKSRGNYEQIYEFAKKGKNNIQTAIDLLKVISEKDLRDTPHDILLNHFENHQNITPKGNLSKEEYNQYILNPRIANELLSPWRDFIQGYFSKDKIDNFTQNPENIITWIKENIHIDNEGNYARNPISPKGVLQHKIADEHSTKILFVAICRSMAIPARYNQVDGNAQYLEDGIWKNFQLEKSQSLALPKGELTLINPDEGVKPVYSTHFTIAKFEDAEYKSLNFWRNPIFDSFPATISLDTGTYRLLTGNRLDDGTVVVRAKEFEILENQKTEQKIEIEADNKVYASIGKIDKRISVKNLDSKKIKMSKILKSKNSVLILIDPSTEPGRHIIAELEASRNALNDWGGNIVLIANKGRSTDMLTKLSQDFKNINIFTDFSGNLEQNLSQFLSVSDEKMLPYVTYIDKNLDCFYISSAYQINTISRIFRVIKGVK